MSVKSERELAIEYLTHQKDSLLLIVDQLNKVGMPASIAQVQKTKLKAYLIVLADLTNVESQELGD